MAIEVALTTVIEAIATDLTAITGQVTPGIRIIIGIHPIAIRGTAILLGLALASVSGAGTTAVTTALYLLDIPAVSSEV